MGTHRLIYIRTDANSQIASGHLMRCLSIAEACKSLGMDVCFLVSEGESRSLFDSLSGTPLDAEDSFRVISLKTAVYDHLEQELPEVLALLGSLPERPVYLLDSYYVTEHYLTSLRPLAKTAYLDDLQLFDYPVDLLVNYDVIPDSLLPSYRAAYQNVGRLLLGAAYTPLRRQFQSRPASIKRRHPSQDGLWIKSQVKNLLITTGGSDPFHFCLRFLKAVMENPSSWPFSSAGITIHIVIGKLNTDRTALFELADTFPFPRLLKLHENVTDMSTLMRDCDLAISAAGTTLYELCALGIPSLSFTMADNQLTAAKAFEAAGAIPCAGDIRQPSEGLMQPFMEFVSAMSGQEDSGQTSYAARVAAHKAMRKLVDGNGALRIAKALEEM